MKLKRIDIANYKNINGSFSFEENEGYIALIGLNGSGKSNLLEVISILFSKIMRIRDVTLFSEFRLVYEIEKQEIEVTLHTELPSENQLPSSLIACYSGEDDRLWKSGFKDYYTKFFNAAIAGADYKPKVLYINKYCWKIAFVSLLFSENEDLKKFIAETLHIDTRDVKITFKKKDDITPQNHDASNWFLKVLEKYGETEITLYDLKNDEDVDLNCLKYPELTPDRIIFYYLYFLHMPDKDRSLGLRADKLIETINIKLGDFDFEDLSEGEKKLILIECITKVLGDENSLVLLDEPDAHTHIAMKKNLLKLISEFEGQTVMTTHSPMFLNKRWEGYKENNIFYMHEGQIEDSNMLQNLNNLSNNEIDYFEGSFILSSKKILVVEGQYDDRYLKRSIEIFADEDPRYSVLKDIAIFSANSAGAAETIYNQILSHCISRLDKVVFLFDYDDAGWKDGWKKIKKLSGDESKIKPMFYQHDYSSDYPTSDNDVEAYNGGKKIKDENSYMVEDLFSENAYSSVIQNVINSRTHKDFRSLTIGKKGTAGAIKTYIEEKYNSFSKKDFEGFRPVLDELLRIFYHL